MRLLRPILLMAAAVAVTVTVPPAASADEPGTRPPECSARFKDPDVRERTINRDTNLHEMSNPPTCAPYGQYLGNLHKGSTFRVYYADPKEPLWCYGYSVQLAMKGYILCDAYN